MQRAKQGPAGLRCCETHEEAALVGRQPALTLTNEPLARIKERVEFNQLRNSSLRNDVRSHVGYREGKETRPHASA